MKKLTTIPGLALATLLAACGGGSSGGGAPAAAPAATPTTAINEQNGAEKSATAYQAASSLYGAGTSSTDAGLNLKEVSPAGRVSAVGLALARISALGDDDFARRVTISGIETVSQNCSGGGSFTISANDADNSSSLTTGDSASFTYNACRIGGTTLSGTMTMDGIAVTGNAQSPSQSLGATFTFTAFTSVGPNGTDRVDGGFSIQTAIQRTPGPIIDATVSGGAIRFVHDGVVRELANFSSSVHVDEQTGRYRYSVEAMLVSEGIRIANPQPFEGSIGAFPSTGVLQVVGAASSSATLTALSATSVRIDVDSNGDGVTDATQTRTWSSL